MNIGPPPEQLPLFDALSGLIPEGTAYLDPAGRVLAANRPCPAPVPGEDPAEAWSLETCIIPEEREALREYLRSAAGNEATPSRQFTCVETPSSPAMRVSVGPIRSGGLLTGFLAIAAPLDQDSTARVALQESEATFRSVMAAAPIGIGLVTNRILGWTSDGLCRMLDYSRSELTGQSARILYESDEEFDRVARVKHPEIIEKGVGSVVTRFRRSDGRMIDVLLNSAAIHPPDLSMGIVFTALDVSAQIAAQNALRESEESYRSLVSNAIYGIYRSSAEGRFLDVNPALLTMLGYESREDLLACDIARDVYVNPEDRDRLTEEFQNRDHLAGVEVEWRRLDGTPITVRLSGRPLRTEEGALSGWEMLVENVSERRLLEIQLLRSQRLEAIGQLAGGIAHDFNNLLTAIGGYSEILLRDLPAKDPARRKVREIHKAGRRAANLTRQLLAFSRRQVLTPGIMDLNSVVRGMESMLQRIIGENIDLSTKLDPALGQVKADEAKVEQVVLNLAVNSRDAMPEGGRLSIETANCRIPEDQECSVVDAPAGAYVSLTVRDNGLGMDGPTLDRIFEPFFTTKDRERGTGLGLATVYGIITQSDGFIHVRSRPGEGAEFRVLFPRADEPLTEKATVYPDAGTLTGTETILLVEDESSVRSMAEEVLSSRGYVVLSAESAEHAIDLARDHAGRIDLLLTDVVLPGLSGPELSRELTPRIPGLLTIFMSGYVDAASHRHAIPDSGRQFVEKPFSPWDLATRVRHVLDRKA